MLKAVAVHVLFRKRAARPCNQPKPVILQLVQKAVDRTVAGVIATKIHIRDRQAFLNDGESVRAHGGGGTNGPGNYLRPGTKFVDSRLAEG